MKKIAICFLMKNEFPNLWLIMGLPTFRLSFVEEAYMVSLILTMLIKKYVLKEM